MNEHQTDYRFTAKPYRPAADQPPTPGRYVIVRGCMSEEVGGAMLVDDKALAFFGAPSLADNHERVLKDAGVFAWGADLNEALTTLRAVAEGRAPALACVPDPRIGKKIERFRRKNVPVCFNEIAGTWLHKSEALWLRIRP